MVFQNRVIPKLIKVILYFLHGVLLYFCIGMLASNIPIPIIGMIFSVQVVLIGAISLAFARTVEVCIQGDCSINLQGQDYGRIIVDFLMIIGVFILCVTVISMLVSIFGA